MANSLFSVIILNQLKNLNIPLKKAVKVQNSMTNFISFKCKKIQPIHLVLTNKITMLIQRHRQCNTLAWIL